MYQATLDKDALMFDRVYVHVMREHVRAGRMFRSTALELHLISVEWNGAQHRETVLTHRFNPPNHLAHLTQAKSDQTHAPRFYQACCLCRSSTNWANAEAPLAESWLLIVMPIFLLANSVYVCLNSGHFEAIHAELELSKVRAVCYCLGRMPVMAALRGP